MTRFSTLPLFLAAMILAGLGVAALDRAMNWGAGLRNDSYLYIVGADNIAAGLGYSRFTGEGEIRPINHNPPLYSAWLAVSKGAAGVPTAEAARASNLALFGVTVVGVVFLVWKLSASPLASLGAGLLVAVSPGMIDVYSMVMTEPLYLPLTLAALYLLSEELREHHPGRLIGSALLIAAAYLTRYVGISLIATAVVGFLAARGAIWQRAARLGVFLGLSAGLPALWLIRNLVLTGSATNRTLAWHAVPPETLEIGVKTVLSWLLPMITLGAKAKGLIALPVLLALVLIAIRLRGKPGSAVFRIRQMGLAELLAVHAIIYSLGFLGTILFVDNSIVPDDRNLSPVYLAGMILAFVALARGAPLVRVPARVGLAAGVLIVALFYAERTGEVVENAYVHGIGYLDVNWRTSGTIQHVRELPDVPIYSNSPVPIYFLAGRVARLAPFRIDPATNQPREDYPAWLQQMRTTLETEGGYLILFDVSRISQDPHDRAWLDDLRLGLDLVDEHSDGEVYNSRPEANE
ncbi:MAG: glycosyltransferase family 39 protein [Anaerolineales bacterium]